MDRHARRRQSNLLSVPVYAVSVWRLSYKRRLFLFSIRPTLNANGNQYSSQLPAKSRVLGVRIDAEACALNLNRQAWASSGLYRLPFRSVRALCVERRNGLKMVRRGRREKGGAGAAALVIGWAMSWPTTPGGGIDGGAEQRRSPHRLSRGVVL